MNNRRFFNVVPRKAQLWAAAVACFAMIIGVVVGYWAGQSGAPLRSSSLHGAAGLVFGLIVAFLIVSLSYVYTDARDRGMPPVLWTLVALLVPNLLGFLLYFVIRKPLTVACPACSRSIPVDQVYCSWCGSSQARTIA